MEKRNPVKRVLRDFPEHTENPKSQAPVEQNGPFGHRGKGFFKCSVNKKACENQKKDDKQSEGYFKDDDISFFNHVSQT